MRDAYSLSVAGVSVGCNHNENDAVFVLHVVSDHVLDDFYFLGPFRNCLLRILFMGLLVVIESGKVDESQVYRLWTSDHDVYGLVRDLRFFLVFHETVLSFNEVSVDVFESFILPYFVFS